MHELHLVAETLKEIRPILLDVETRINAEQKNLTVKTFSTKIVMRWRHISKKYGPYLFVIKVSGSLTADTMSKLIRK